MQRVGVGGRVDGDRLDPELVQRADDADGDLAAVRDQDAREHWPRARRAAVDRLELEQELAVLDRLPVLGVDPPDDRPPARPSPRSSASSPRGCRASGRADRVALLGRTAAAPGDGRAVEGADHRRLDADHARIERRRRRARRRSSPPPRRPRRGRGDEAFAGLGRAPDGDAQARRPRSSPRRRRSPGRSGRSRGSARRGSRRPRRPRATPGVPRPRIVRRSGSASSPKSASRSSSSSLAASPGVALAELVEVGLRLGLPHRRRAARPPAGRSASISPGGVP